LDSLTLEDFAVNFDRVKIPEKPDGEQLTPEEIRRAAQSFFDAFQAR
jgi:hypothetical protein